MDTSLRPSAPRLACRALPPERFLLSGVHLFDPQQDVDVEGDLLIENGKIAGLGTGVKKPSGIEVINDLRGCWVFPGFVDPHCHLRTPGFEYKEDLVSGSQAAGAGGYVAVVAMANTDPVVDSGPVAAWVLEEAAENASVRVGQVGAVSKGLAGGELAEMLELADSGVVAFSDDGKPVADADLLLHALRYAHGSGRPLLLHLESSSLSVDGVMHEGKWSARLGLRGIPSACETGPLARDLEIVRYVADEITRVGIARGEEGAGSRNRPLAHFQHLSSAESVLCWARARAAARA